ncbi:hypothetical protein THRCLA_21310 [Thraustotheca clavata]|uniref:Uncharacterized protein n=1 Tax=Thraustotheca clavata TaxID=74557 RepID=A0A1V9ZXX1_9STRA|nr:hypothetical protein THRCLA_21310 [Thraustotheca clavata]
MLTINANPGTAMFSFDRVRARAEAEKQIISASKPGRRSSSGSSVETSTSTATQTPLPYRPAFTFDLESMLIHISKSIESAPIKSNAQLKKNKVYGDYVDEHYSRSRFAFQARQRY